jgi:tetratricopeptide (TPR) repeat protein
VFEVLEAPVVMVMVPQHAFVRWRLHANHHVNWDVNAGDSFSDDEYRKGIASIPFGSDTEERNKFLKDMTADELEGFHRILLADEYRRSGQLDDAIEAFRLALQYQPSNPAVHNNYARMIATERALQQADLLDEALDHAKKAVALLPNDEGIIDTLAVVHAARGEFERAIEVEMTGLKSPDRLTAYYLHIHPADTDWKDQESVPFEY